MTVSHAYTDPDDNEDKGNCRDISSRINEEGDDGKAPEISSPDTSTDDLIHPILSKLGVLLLPISPQ